MDKVIVSSKQIHAAICIVLQNYVCLLKSLDPADQITDYTTLAWNTKHRILISHTANNRKQIHHNWRAPSSSRWFHILLSTWRALRRATRLMKQCRFISDQHSLQFYLHCFVKSFWLHKIPNSKGQIAEPVETAWNHSTLNSYFRFRRNDAGKWTQSNNLKGINHLKYSRDHIIIGGYVFMIRNPTWCDGHQGVEMQQMAGYVQQTQITQSISKCQTQMSDI